MWRFWEMRLKVKTNRFSKKQDLWEEEFYQPKRWLQRDLFRKPVIRQSVFYYIEGVVHEDLNWSSFELVLWHLIWVSPEQSKLAELTGRSAGRWGKGSKYSETAGEGLPPTYELIPRERLDAEHGSWCSAVLSPPGKSWGKWKDLRVLSWVLHLPLALPPRLSPERASSVTLNKCAADRLIIVLGTLCTYI